MAALTVHPAAVRRLAGRLRTLGLPAGELLTSCELPADPEPLAERVDRRCYLAVKAAASRALADPWLGLLLGEAADPVTLDLFGAVVSHARTIGEAVRLGIEYAPLWEHGPEIRAEATGEGLALHYHDSPHPDPLANAIDGQESVVFLAALCRRLGGPAPARTIGHFACPRPRHAHAIERVRALGCEPRFGGDSWRIDLPHALLERPLPPANPAVARLVRAHADAELRAARHDAGLAARVERALRRGLAQRWGVAEVARALAMSPRALQHALTLHGTSFSAELQRVRLELARQMLGRAGSSVAAIARALGFASPSSFSRFYRAATGVSPQAHRRGAHGQTDARKLDTSS